MSTCVEFKKSSIVLCVLLGLFWHTLFSKILVATQSSFQADVPFGG